MLAAAFAVAFAAGSASAAPPAGKAHLHGAKHPDATCPSVTLPGGVIISPIVPGTGDERNTAVVTPSGNINQVCHYVLPAGSVPVTETSIQDVPCPLPGGVVATRSTLTLEPDGTATLVCHFHHAKPAKPAA